MASGDSINAFMPTANEPPSSNYATPDKRNGHPVLNFDQTTVQAAVWSYILPRNYGGNGLTATPIWTSKTATSGTVKWRIYFERNADADTQADTAASDSFASAQSASATTPGTSGQYQYTAVTFTNGAQIDSIAVGELFRIKIDRDTSVGSNMTDTAQLYGIELKET